MSTRYGLVGGEPTFDSRDEALSWIEDNYPNAAEVTVQYDPDRPGRAVLVPGASRAVPVLLAELAFIAIGVYILLNPGVAAI